MLAATGDVPTQEIMAAADKLDAMNDADFEARQFHFTDE